MLSLSFCHSVMRRVASSKRRIECETSPFLALYEKRVAVAPADRLLFLSSVKR